MKLTLNFNDLQWKGFRNFLEDGLASLDQQKIVLEQELIKLDSTTDDAKNINKYICEKVMPQQLIIAEILQSIEDAEHPLITPGYEDKGKIIF